MAGARFVKRVGERGVVTLPTEVRDMLDVAEGDIVEFEVLRVIKKARKGKAETPTTDSNSTPGANE
jgi:AbrB family looped-hinge helix DNA binding protein